MKLKVGDPGAATARVLLDGVELVNCCIEADDEAGEVVCYLRDAEGNPILDSDGETLLTETKRGRVTIALSAGLELQRHTQPRATTMATAIKRYSSYGKFSEGDYVSRDGSGVHLVTAMVADGFSATFECVVAPESGWCAVGEKEPNLCSRYSRVHYCPPGQTGMPKDSSAA